MNKYRQKPNSYVMFQNKNSVTGIYTLLQLYSLLQKNLCDDEIATKLKEKDKESSKFKGIRCPHCKWQPNGSSRWFCSDCDHPEYYYNGCQTKWNTFETEGICPGCKHKWRWTTCLSCGDWSKHKDWYTSN